jgi:hypothetical protein
MATIIITIQGNDGPKAFEFETDAIVAPHRSMDRRGNLVTNHELWGAFEPTIIALYDGSSVPENAAPLVAAIYKRGLCGANWRNDVLSWKIVPPEQEPLRMISIPHYPMDESPVDSDGRPNIRNLEGNIPALALLMTSHDRRDGIITRKLRRYCRDHHIPYKRRRWSVTGERYEVGGGHSIFVFENAAHRDEVQQQFPRLL